MIDEERRPLLEDNEGQNYNSTSSKGQSWSRQSVREWYQDRRSIFRIAIVALLMFICSVGCATPMIEITRSLSCAEYYENHPHSDFGNFDDSKRDLCDINAIEQRSASILSLIQIFGSLTATLSIFVIQPKLHQWGKKSIFLFSVAIMSIERIAPLFLPLGYPFRPSDEPMAISPTLSFRLFIGFSMLGEALGTEMIPIFCLRLFMTEASSADTKTEGFLYLQQANMLAITFGPALTTWIGSLFPFSSAKVLHMIRILQFDHIHRRDPIPLPPSRGPIPPVPPGIKVNNVAPYLVSVITIIFTLIIGQTVLPKDQKTSATTSLNSEEDRRQEEESKKKQFDEPFWWRLIPRKDIDGNRDWRILTIVLVTMCHIGSAYTLNIYLVYFGHAFRWGQESVALVISWIGIVRVLCLLFLTPAAIMFFEGKVKKPAPISHLSLGEIKEIAKTASAGEPPIASESEIQPRIEEDEEFDDHDPTGVPHSIKGAIVLWRATIDRTILALAWSFDILGWFLCAVFTPLGSATMLLLGGTVVALGAPGLAVRQAVDLVIVGDVLARTDEFPVIKKTPEDQQEQSNIDHQPPKTKATNAQADELYFSLITLFDCFITFFSPIWCTFIYNRTLSSFPAANWLIAVVLYTAAMIMHFSMPIHRRSSSSHGHAIA